MIEVVEPRSVQAELARIGAELAGRYTGSTPQRVNQRDRPAHHFPSEQ
jgi:hypothetical protein